MTIIAACASKGVMVSDTLLVNVSEACPSVAGFAAKLVRCRDGSIAGAAGPGPKCAVLLDWAEAGRIGKLKPVCWEDAQLLVLTPDRRLLLWAGAARADELLDDFAAIGSGDAFARAAWFVGASPLDCVRAACHVSPYCGGEPREMKLDDTP